MAVINNPLHTRHSVIKEKFQGRAYYPGEYLTKKEGENDFIMILKSGKVGFAYKKYGS